MYLMQYKMQMMLKNTFCWASGIRSGSSDPEPLQCRLVLRSCALRFTVNNDSLPTLFHQRDTTIIISDIVRAVRQKRHNSIGFKCLQTKRNGQHQAAESKVLLLKVTNPISAFHFLINLWSFVFIWIRIVLLKRAQLQMHIWLYVRSYQSFISFCSPLSKDLHFNIMF